MMDPEMAYGLDLTGFFGIPDSGRPAPLPPSLPGSPTGSDNGKGKGKGK